MDPQPFLNTLDYIVIGTILMSGVLALLRGFVREFLSLVAWVGAFFIAAKFYSPAIPWARQFIKHEKFAEWVAMGGVFLLALVILSIIGYFISGFIKGKALTWIDRSIGFLYGLARGVLIISLVYLGAVLVLWPEVNSPQSEDQQNGKKGAPAPEMLMQAKTKPLMHYCAKKILVLLPEDLIDKGLTSVDAKDFEAIRSLRHETPSVKEAEDVDLEKGPIDIDALFKKESD